MDLLTAIVVFTIAFASMFLGALVGGVGLVTRPILIFLGFSPQIIIGTSKASGIIGELPAVLVLQKTKKSYVRETMFIASAIFLGTIIATFFAINADVKTLRILIGTIVLLTAIFLLLKKGFGEIKTKAKFSKITRETISFIGTAIISFFSILSGGLGPIYSVFYSWLYGETYKGASSIRRVADYIGGFASSIIFIVKGVIDWQLFIILSTGLACGSYFGIKYALKKGESWTKYIIITVAIASGIKLLGTVLL